MSSNYGVWEDSMGEPVVFWGRSLEAEQINEQ